MTWRSSRRTAAHRGPRARRAGPSVPPGSPCASSAAWSPAPRWVVASRRPSSLALVIDAVSGGAQEREGREQDRDKEHPGERRRVAHLEVSERDVVEMEAV